MRPFRNIIDFENIFVPVAIEEFADKKYGGRTYKILFIFGIRVALWSTTPNPMSK